MKMILFRPCFVATGLLLVQLVAPVSASPQFGARPYLEVLDEIPSEDTPHVSSASVVVAASVPSASVADSQANTSPQSNGASHHLPMGGVHPALLFSAAAATSAIFLVF